ncbi:hypothetical protein ACTJJX_02475 [Pseudomonas sp. 22490]|uniref:hypothetical protein n=1 Tax=Pseudomonas sp. 22490 TaxID=3453929 RepID=UPI003F842353
MNHELSNLMEIEKPRTAPQCCPLDASNLRPAIDFPHWWQRAAVLVGLPASAGLESVSVVGAGLPLLLKRLFSLDDLSRRALLVTMACLVNPDSAAWLCRETGFHFGQLAAGQLDDEVFQVLVGLLATFPTIKSE